MSLSLKLDMTDGIPSLLADMSQLSLDFARIQIVIQNLLALGLERKRWTGCAPGSSLDLMLHDGGHTMPVDWFRAALDWFEEPPAAVEAPAPLTRSAGARPPGRFKTVPSAGPALTVTEAPGAGRRLQAPGGSKNASQ